MSFLDRIPSWAYVAGLAIAAYHFIAGFLDALPPAP